MNNKKQKQVTINLNVIERYWQEAEKLTDDLDPARQFSTPQLVDYLNAHLPDGYEKMTKTKITYLSAQNILHPIEAGEGEVRTSWRYTQDDVRRTLVIELLKTRENLSVQESKGWLQSFDEARSRKDGSAYRLPMSDGDGVSPAAATRPPSAISSAYALLRNRTLGTLITALAGETEEIPQDCLIAIRLLNRQVESEQFDRLTWDQARSRLEIESVKWYLAATDSYLKLYIYNDLQDLRNNRDDLAQAFQQYRWYVIALQDMTNQSFEVIIGLPKPTMQQPSVAALDRSLGRYIEERSTIQIGKFLGLRLLLRTAFVNQPTIVHGTNLAALAEIIASATDSWDYCAILIPENTDDGVVKRLQVQEGSSLFPSRLKDMPVDIEKPLAGWCYRHRQGVVVQSTIENDPRVAFFEDEEWPEAAAAFPAMTTRQQVVGVVYVARRPRTDEEQAPFSEEALASLQAFGYICGDMLERDRLEVSTVQGMSQLATRKLVISFDHLKDMLRKVVDKVRRGVSPENAADSWIYLLTLNIETTYQDRVTQWLCKQGVDSTEQFLANRLWDSPHSDPLLVGKFRQDGGRFVFAVLQPVYLDEEQYKQRISVLQQELDQIYLGKLVPKFYASAVTFRYGSLLQSVNDEAARELVDNLSRRTEERLVAGPYFRRGHQALYSNDLDRAVSEFEDALRYAPQSWYGYKHLAEARMLQGTRNSLEIAVVKCQEALKREPQYASAHCLLADCFSYLGRFSEAIIEYEKALAIDSTRLDFLTRYGQALAAMTPSEYQKALEELGERESDLVRRHKFFSEPWEEAIDKFGQVLNLSTRDDRTLEEHREARVHYYYYRGYAYLQAGIVTEAIEDFMVGRKLAPENLEFAQAYLHALRLQRNG